MRDARRDLRQRRTSAGKRGLFHDLVPKAARIAMLVNPANRPIAELMLRDISEAARAGDDGAPQRRCSLKTSPARSRRAAVSSPARTNTRRRTCRPRCGRARAPRRASSADLTRQLVQMWRRDSDESRPNAGTFIDASTSNRPTIKQTKALVTSEAHGQPWARDSSHRVCM
jgi:hypothetical protein